MNKPSDRQPTEDNVYLTNDDDLDVDLQGLKELCTYIDVSEFLEQQSIENEAISTTTITTNLSTCGVNYQGLEELCTYL